MMRSTICRGIEREAQAPVWGAPKKEKKKGEQRKKEEKKEDERKTL